MVSRLDAEQKPRTFNTKGNENSLCSEKDGILTEKHIEEAMRKIAWWMLDENRR